MTVRLCAGNATHAEALSLVEGLQQRALSLITFFGQKKESKEE